MCADSFSKSDILHTMCGEAVPNRLSNALDPEDMYRNLLVTTKHLDGLAFTSNAQMPCKIT